MTEQYDVAAARHYRVAEQLETSGEIDDAAYHYGLVDRYPLCGYPMHARECRRLPTLGAGRTVCSPAARLDGLR